MMDRGFWDKLKKPIVGLAPMDGVTDFAFRHMLAKYGKPSVIFTEFVNVEGLARGAVKMLSAFIYEEKERPVVGQLFGVEADSFYKSALMLCALGFDGIDINMGCPVNKIAKRGSGAGLIKTPALAKKIIETVKKAAEDWENGADLRDVGIGEEMIKKINEMNLGRGGVARKIIPVSVKTRIGYDKIVAGEWVKHLLEVKPANITMHGRTLKQMYKGAADWDALARAGALCKGSGTSFLGNGDIKSMQDALKKIKDYGVDGVLVGRAACGNPWFFSGADPSVKERLAAALEHVEYFGTVHEGPFYPIRKHLAWYCKRFEGAKELRMALMQAKNLENVKTLIKNIISSGCSAVG